MAQVPPKTRRRGPLPKPTDPTKWKTVLVEVPRASLDDVMVMDWDDVVLKAERERWRMQDTADYYWCAKDHALVRKAIPGGMLDGLPVLCFQNY